MKLRNPKPGDVFVTSMYLNLMVGKIVDVTLPDNDRFLRYGTIETYDGKDHKLHVDVSLGYLNDPREYMDRNLQRIKAMQNQIRDMMKENDTIQMYLKEMQ